MNLFWILNLNIRELLCSQTPLIIFERNETQTNKSILTLKIEIKGQ